MVEKSLTQSVQFLEDKENKLQSAQGGPRKESKYGREVTAMDVPTEMAIVESTKNYNIMINAMFRICSQKCIKSFKQIELNPNEKICVENCQKKFYRTYSIGESFVNVIMEEANNTDLFTNKNEVDVINSGLMNNSGAKNKANI
jgi:hypothetical protein